MDRPVESEQARPGFSTRELPTAAAAAGPHSVNGELRAQVIGRLGITAARLLADTLTLFGVPQAEREHALYPMVLQWRESGINGLPIEVMDLVSACGDLRRKFPDGRLERGGIVAVLKGYTRTAALRRREDEERRRSAEDPMRERKPMLSLVRAQERLDAMVDRLLTYPEAPVDFREKIATSMRLCAELRSLGRSPRELSEDWTQWPATYLPQLGPEPLPS